MGWLSELLSEPKHGSGALLNGKDLVLDEYKELFWSCAAESLAMSLRRLTTLGQSGSFPGGLTQSIAQNRSVAEGELMALITAVWLYHAWAGKCASYDALALAVKSMVRPNDAPDEECLIEVFARRNLNVLTMEHLMRARGKSLADEQSAEQVVTHSMAQGYQWLANNFGAIEPSPTEEELFNVKTTIGLAKDSTLLGLQRMGLTYRRQSATEFAAAHGIKMPK
ncbi:hypothetical protein JI739_24160 [Ramlibacter sp. AW1]|uniref:Uncharacterized protein n=1 Tax=Ramlibacter aurantiacus TaxID=2801330 RepID=A0A936ZZS2_9BURK|nr:hypothetical protein [Ramlibacter aurantiacus]MBL0423449.1 hypothetical protein [Ramlibacter aurantiacus]